MQRCWRCKGAKFMFECNGGYTSVDMGAPQVVCPSCNGSGKTESLEDAAKKVSVKKKTTSKKKEAVL